MGDDASFQSAAGAILQRVTGGPYGRVGMSGFFVIDMDWNANLASPVDLRCGQARDVNGCFQ